MSRKPYELPLEEGPGEGLEDPWWEDDLVPEPAPEPEPEVPDGYDESWEEAPLLAEEADDWGPDDEDITGFDDLDAWDPLIQAEEAPLPAEVFEPPKPEPEPEPEPEDDESVPEPTEDSGPLPEIGLEPPDEPWDLKVVSWAPAVMLEGRAVGATCATSQAGSLVGEDLVDFDGEQEVLLEIEGRRVMALLRVSPQAAGRVVLGRDALAQARLLVDPSQN